MFWQKKETIKTHQKKLSFFLKKLFLKELGRYAQFISVELLKAAVVIREGTL